MTGETARGWLYDGASAVRQDVALAAASGGLVLIFGDGRSEGLARDTLLFGAKYRDSLLYRRTDRNGWQLTVERPLPPLIEALLPKGGDYGRWIDRIGLVPALAAGLAVSGLILFAGYRFPAWAAPYVPQAWEERYGETLVGDFGGKFCTRPDGLAALDKLAARLSPDAAGLKIRVVDVPIANAAALPGGYIVIFDELLKEARGPEEVAGVLAHEIAHIDNRHVTQAMIRDLGLGLVVTAFGGNVGGNINTVLAARYSRDAEREADAGAIATLARANISPEPSAAFFERLARDEESLGPFAQGVAYISSHPLSRSRQRLFRQSAVRGRAYAPVLNEDEWANLADICWSGPAEAGAAPSPPVEGAAKRKPS